MALLVYLALSPGRTAQREHLLDLLWADLDPTAATHAYRQTIWYIRQRLGEGCLRAGGNQLVLTPQTETDREGFLAAVERQDWDRAVALYTGDFLPGFAAPGGAEFEKWADLERWRLRGLFLRAGEALARRQLASGHMRDAMALARRIRDADRSGEPGWRLLLEALVAAGDPVGAAVEADGLELMLREEGRDPEPATRVALRIARQQPQHEPAGETPSHGLVAELVGREREFGEIVAAWEAVRHGASRHIHLTGDAGLGKSRLLADAQTRLKASGARTVLVRAAPGERSLSYALAADLVTALASTTGSAAISSSAAGALLGLNPALAARYPAADVDRFAGDELMRRRVLAAAELVAAVADEGPLALMIDDVHWMDGSSRQLVAALLGRLGHNPVLVVTTARPGPEGALERTDTTHLVLDPLSVLQVGALVASFGTLPDADWANTLPQRLCATSSGFPLTALETLELAMERGILQLGDGAWRCSAPADLEQLMAGGAALRHRLEGLTRDQRWLLLLLAIHGTPAPLDLLRTTTRRPDDALQTDLGLLELRGLATREQGEWQPAHDAIAELAAELAPMEARQTAHTALGRAVGASANEPAALPRAAQHFAAAGDTDALNLVFRRWVRVARARADRRPLKALAQELLGGEGNGRVDALVRRLPMHLRLGLDTPARVAAVALVLILAALGLASRIAAHGDVAVRVVGLVPDGDSVRTVQIQVTEQDLLDQRTLDVSRGSAVPDLPKRLARPIGPAYLGNGAWTWVIETGGSDGQEPMVLTPKGRVQVPPAPGDDAVGSASPDGRFLAMYTDRWAASNAGDVGIFDIATGSLRQVTSGPDRDLPGPWSPDGTRIAFERTPYGLKSPALCWVSFDGRRYSCFTPGGWNLQRIVSGWISPHDILAMGVDSTGVSYVYSVNLDTRSSTRLVSADYASGLVDSPWLLCIQTGEGSAEPELQLRRIDVLGHVVHLSRMSSLARPPTLALMKTAATARSFLDRLRIAGPSDSAVSLGVPYRYEAAGSSADHKEVEVPVLEWDVADSSVATIDTQGVLVGKRPGLTTVFASAGGWRRASVSVRVVSRRDTSALSEAWAPPWLARWRPFGEPRPRVVGGPAGPALFVAGDSSYYSGVYSRAAFPAGGGLGVRAIVRTPVSLVKWQMLHIALVPLADSVALDKWDHTTADLPLNSDDRSRHCGINYPAGEAQWAKQFAALSAGLGSVRVPVDTLLGHGRPWQLTLQLLPDGRCGVAINGRVVRISESRQPTDLPRHVVIDGQSVRTRILVGHLQVWRGVRQDIDWGRLDSSHVQRGP